ncbi:MAG TPA: hypothetical protein O0X70_05285 [Methanocorpusculum sp.]|nr:hypothetical protein [Methanocorpusculum sp.]
MNDIQEKLEKIGMTGTEFFTACANLFLCGENVKEYCLRLNRVISTSDKMRTTLHNILDETYFTILAVKGAQVLLNRDDIVKDIFMQLNNKCHALPTDEELTLWVQQYCIMRADRMAQHRADRFTQNLAMENEKEE